MTAPRGEAGGSGSERLAAPAKLTLTLRITGVRADGYHLLDAEMVSLDLTDTLVVTDRSDGRGEIRVGTDPAAAPVVAVADVPTDDGNLVARALAAVGRRADVALTKRIPPGAGLGGGSSDAGAILRWAGCADPAVAAAIGADVPFCVRGGRARVTGIGDVLEPLPFEARTFLLLVSPFGVDTTAVYRAYDHRSRGAAPAEGPPPVTGARGGNDLEAAALVVEPRLAAARDALAAVTGGRPRLAGSGSTWFVEVDGDGPLVDAGWRAVDTSAGRSWLVPARTLPAQEPARGS